MEKQLLPFIAGKCPDSAYCLEMGGCMSGCTRGPSAEAAPLDVEEFTEEATGVELDEATIAVRSEVLANA